MSRRRASREDSGNDETKWDGLTLGKSWAAHTGPQGHKKRRVAGHWAPGPRAIGRPSSEKETGSWPWEGRPVTDSNYPKSF